MLRPVLRPLFRSKNRKISRGIQGFWSFALLTRYLLSAPIFRFLERQKHKAENNSTTFGQNEPKVF
jgi:hypothetical protein